MSSQENSSAPSSPFVEDRIDDDNDLNDADEIDRIFDVSSPFNSGTPAGSESGVVDQRRRRDGNVYAGADDDEDSGEELFGDNFERDYRPMPQLDVYEGDQLDDASYSELSLDARIAAESEMKKREKAEGRLTGRMRRGLDIYEDSASEMSEIDSSSSAPKRMHSKTRRVAALFGETGEAEEMIESIENLEDTRGMTVREWVVQMAPKREIYNRFKNFLRTSTDEKGRNIFRDKIRAMSQENRQSFEVDYHILAASEQVLAYFLPDAPLEMLEIFNAAAKEVVLSMFPNYGKISKEIYVRITDLPLIEDIRALRQLHLNQLVRTHGVVSSATSILPQLSLVKYDCLKCHYVLGPFVQTQTEETRPGSCPECQSAGPFSINMEETIYQNYQHITLQEAPGNIAAGRVPRSKDAILLGLYFSLLILSYSNFCVCI